MEGSSIHFKEKDLKANDNMSCKAIKCYLQHVMNDFVETGRKLPTIRYDK